MLRSMTGFGRCVMEDADWTQTWEIRSVNNRHLDLKWRLPLQARGLESRLERVVRRFAARGRMEITLTLQQRGAAANLRFDAAQASAMLDQVAALADLHGDTFEPDYNALFAIPTLWERESEDGDDEMEERLEEGLIAALEDWNESRETEGAALARDMTSRIAQMEEWVSRIDERAPEIKEERFAVLRERLSEAHRRARRGSGCLGRRALPLEQIPFRRGLFEPASLLSPRSPAPFTFHPQPVENVLKTTKADEKALLEAESRYCSYGDTVHYLEPAKLFAGCNGSFLYDYEDKPYLDLQMWYSAVNFGYANPRLNDALKRQIDTLPQVASQYLHKEKIELAAMLCESIRDAWGEEGRVHFNVGGSQAIEDSLKLVRNACGGKSLMIAFEGGYHGRTLGASSITSSYRYRRRYGHFGERALFVPFPYCFRCPYGKRCDDCGMFCADQFERLFETEYYGVWDPKAGEAEYAAFYVECIQGTGGYVIPPDGYYPRLKKVLDEHKIMLVDDEIQMGFYRTGKLWGLQNFGITPDVVVFGKAMTNGLNPLAGIWAKERYINPQVFPCGSTHSTFASNPLGTAVALETMRMLAEEDYETRVREMGAYFLEGLRELKSRYAIIGDVDGLGLALRAEICAADGFTPDKAMMDRIVDEGIKGDLMVDGKRYGLVLDVGGYYKNVITLAPSLNITREEVDLAMRLLDEILRRVTKN